MIRPAQDRRLRCLSFLVRFLAWTPVLLAPALLEAAELRTRIEFDPARVNLRETAEGTEVAMRATSRAGGGEVSALPMSLHAFYVPAGFEVAEVRAIAREEQRIGHAARLSRSGIRADDAAAVTRPFPEAVLDPSTGTHPARPVASLGSGFFAGHRVHSLALFPVRREATGELVLTRAFDVEIELVPAAGGAPLVRARSSEVAERAYREALAAIVENPHDIAPESSPGPGSGSSSPAFPSDLPGLEGATVDMVVVTTAALAGSFEEFVAWKTKKGIATVVRTVEWIDANYPAGHDRAERVRLFLQDAYSRWGTFLVLIGGDYEDVTPRIAFNRFFFGGAEIPTDQYWACLDGNWNADGDDRYGEGELPNDSGDEADLLPDVFIGRAPVSTPEEVATFVAKSFTYDRSPPSGYVEDHCVLAEVLFPSDWHYGDPTSNITLDGKQLTEAMDALVAPGWARTKRYQSDDGENRQIALQELSAGHHLLTIMNHGDAFKFSVGNGANPFIHVADTDTLTNGDRLSVVLATACNPNQFDLEACGESMLNNPNGGAVVSIGPTRVDFPLSAADFHEEMLRLAFSHGVTRFGAMTQVNRVPFAAAAGPDATPDRWTMLSKNLLGDPELRLWTREPRSLFVSHRASVALGAASIGVTVTDDVAAPVSEALVCVSDDAGTYARAWTDAAGQATLPLSSSETGVVDVVVSRREFRPSQSTFTIDPVAEPNLGLDAFSFDDDTDGASSGNGDGVLDAGETVEVELVTLNGGSVDATSSLVIASVEAGSHATFDLLIDGARDVARVYVGPHRKNPATMPFTIEFGSTQTSYIGAPSLSFAADTTSGDEGVFVWQDELGWHLWWSAGSRAMEVTGEVTTDGRVRRTEGAALEPSSDTISLSTSGDTMTIDAATGADDLFDRLDFSLADDSMLSLTSPLASFGNVAASASKGATVVLAVDPTALPGQVGVVDLLFTSTSGGPWVSELPLVVAGPKLEAWIFAIDDSPGAPLSGNGNGIVEVGETVRLTPTVLNRGSGAASGVSGVVTAERGITFVDDSDGYGELARLAQSGGEDGYVFTIDDPSGTSIELTLSDRVARSWTKTIEFAAPPAPGSVGFRSTPSAITLTWTAPDSVLDLAGYNVYRSPTGGARYARRNSELLRAGARFVDDGLGIGDTFHYRVTAVDRSGNESAPSGEIQAWTTLAQAPGWPRNAGGNVFPSIGISDVDASGESEIFVGSKDFSFYGFQSGGEPLAGFPIETSAEVWGTPALADLDEDGDEEILWGSNDSRFYAVHHDGSPVFGTEPHLVDLAGVGALIRSTATVADVDFDSDLEFFFGTDVGRLYAFNHDGTGLTDSTGLLYTVKPEAVASRIWGPIAVADLDGDLVRELVFTSWNDSVYAVTPDGELVSGFPRGASGALENDYRTGPVVGDLDADGTMEILAGNINSTLYAYDHDGSGYLNPDGSFVTLGAGKDIRCVPALANLDADPELEIVFGALDGNVYVLEHDGSGFLDPDPLVPFADLGESVGISSSPLVVDVDGDGDFEILVGHRNGGFYGFHHDGSPVIGMPIPTNDAIFSTAAAADVDGDGDVDVAFASFDQTVNVIDFDGASYPGAYEWPTYGGNNFRTSAYGVAAPYQTGVGVGNAGFAFSLLQNHPNPFSGGTSIEYRLPQTMHVALRIYDVSGRLVRTLVSGVVEPGDHRVSWDGRDGSGRAVSSGVYFYRLDGGDESLTRKILRLR